MIADYVLEFRFEFLWPFWLLLRSLHDSIKYQGIIFAVFFGSIAFFSDLICYMFLPVHWLFFVASTYVWVQYVWHTDKGICLSTVLLWLFFVYIEAYLRLNNFKTIDLCRPFAAHCIGYPIVTLGFGFKSYISYKYRLKKQKTIQKQNQFYHSLVTKALPLEFHLKESDYDQEISIKEQNAEIASKNTKSTKSSIISTALAYYLNSHQPNNNSSNNAAEHFAYIQQKDSVNMKKSSEKNFSQKYTNSECADISKTNFSTKQYSNCSIKSNKQLIGTNAADGGDQVNGLNLPSFSIQSLALTQNSFHNQNGNVNLNGINVNSNGNLVLMGNGSSKHSSNHNRSSSNNFMPNNSHTNININMTINTTAIASATATATTDSQNPAATSNTSSSTSTKKNKNKENKNLPIANNKQVLGKISDDSASEFNFKQGQINSLEEELKKLKIEIDQQKKVEQYLRDQINYITKCDRSEKLKQENETLQSKINDLRAQKEKERDQLEKQLQDERKKRTDLEIQLSREKKLRETTNQAAKKSTSPTTSNGPSVNELNQKKINQLENENKELKNHCSKKQDIIYNLESEIKSLSTLVQSNESAESLKEKMRKLEEKNNNLQESLREETRFKMNLFSALGEAKRKIEYVNRQLDAKDTELSMVKAIIKQSLSPNSFSNGLLNETAHTDLISQLLADQLTNLQHHNFSSNQMTGNQTFPSEGSRSLSCSSPAITDLNRVNFSPTSCNDNNLLNFDSDNMGVNNLFPKI
ncbi:macoilin-1-like isoform X1 [Brachionus plicatilis]|uniref:Macoilin n=1 Tax=Brachionus plicatilis TaxID=10195 RepID=A0A3M7T1I7_BRAPC|nr:macoilin-1-like isoform X1 [Brachionus plicatilis]